VIEQIGTHRRIVFGEVFGDLPRETDRVRRIHGAGGRRHPVGNGGDGRVPIWEKFIFLVALAGFTGATRLPIGPVWNDPFIRAQFLDGCREIERLARAEGVEVVADRLRRSSATSPASPGRCARRC
jgi:ketopantoate reductase